MNSAINFIRPLASVNQRVQLSQNQGTNEGFGSVLQSTLTVGEESGVLPELESFNLSEEELSTLQELLNFLKKTSLSDLDEGTAVVDDDVLVNNQSDSGSLLLQLLKNLVGNDEDSLAEFFANIDEIDLDSEQDEATLDSQSLIGANVMDLFTILKQVAKLSEEEWQQLPLAGTVNLLKLMKFQELLSQNKDMTQDEAAIQKQLKNLLEGITGRLEKWVSNQQQKTSGELDFTVLMDKGQKNSLDTVRNTFTRFEIKEGTISDGLTLKTAENNNQSSGLPFQMTKLEQFVLTATKGGQTVSQEEFVKQFENIVSKANLSGANGVNKLLIRLNPENLGSLRIELIQKDGLMTARILATTAQAKDMLERQLNGLKQAFNGQNIQIEKIEISQAFSAFNSEKFTQKDADEQNRQHQENKKESTDEADGVFTGSLAEALLNLEV